MNFYGAKDLAAAFRLVRSNTITIAEEIGEEHYGFRATPDTRPVGQILVHIAKTPDFALVAHKGRLTSFEGFNFMEFMGARMAEELKPRTKAEILTLLRDSGEEFASWLETVSDDVLAEVFTFPAGAQPPSKTRFEMLMSVKEHEMHHRGQLMLIERMLGITPHLTRAQQARMQQMAAAQK